MTEDLICIPKYKNKIEELYAPKGRYCMGDYFLDIDTKRLYILTKYSAISGRKLTVNLISLCSGNIWSGYGVEVCDYSKITEEEFLKLFGSKQKRSRFKKIKKSELAIDYNYKGMTTLEFSKF